MLVTIQALNEKRELISGFHMDVEIRRESDINVNEESFIVDVMPVLLQLLTEKFNREISETRFLEQITKAIIVVQDESKKARFDPLEKSNLRIAEEMVHNTIDGDPVAEEFLRCRLISCARSMPKDLLVSLTKIMIDYRQKEIISEQRSN